MTRLKVTRLTVLGAAAIIASAMASPATAWQSSKNRGAANAHASSHHRTHVVYRGTNRYADTNAAWNTGPNYDRRYQSGFWPADVAAGVVGGAAATAGAIATAPFRAADSYAWNNGYRSWDNRSYAQRNGFVCTPGGWFKGDDGRRYPCQ